MTSYFAVAVPPILYVVIFGLSYFLPAKRVEGYITDAATGQPVIYYLNALPVCLIVIAAYVTGGYLGWYSLSWLYEYRWEMLIGACATGIVYSAMLVFTEPRGDKPVVAEFFLGRCQNLIYFNRIDAKMYLYMVGAILLVLNIFSYSFFHFATFGEDANPGVILQAALLTFFAFDYLFFERVHVYTYDIFAENLGFKLAWGCLTFYPFFYAIGLFSTAHLPQPEVIRVWGEGWLIFCCTVFFSGWMLARGANMQKYYFKRFPERLFLGIQPQVLSDQSGILLTSGFWGVARHINYLGEILMALAVAAALGHFDVVWPWLYPLYYLILLVARERDDDRRCAAKYGDLWVEYQGKVPYRIVPYIY